MDTNKLIEALEAKKNPVIYGDYPFGNTYAIEVTAYNSAIDEAIELIRQADEQAGETILADAVLAKISQWGKGELDEDEALHQIEALAIEATKSAEQLAEVRGTHLSRCPKCGGPADNGHDRCYPPNPYYCRKCTR